MAELTGEKRSVGRPPSGRGRLPIALSIRGNDEWKRWVEDYGKARGLTPADLVEQALEQMARRDKRPGPPGRVE